MVRERKASGEALVNRQRIGWAFNHVGNEDGMVMAPGADTKGQIVTGKIFVYPLQDVIRIRTGESGSDAV